MISRKTYKGYEKVGGFGTTIYQRARSWAERREVVKVYRFALELCRGA